VSFHLKAGCCFARVQPVATWCLSFCWLATHIKTAVDSLNLVISWVQLWPVGAIAQEKWSWEFSAADVEVCCAHHALVHVRQLNWQEQLPVAHDISEANVLNHYFSSVSINDDGKLPSLLRQFSANVTLANIHFDSTYIDLMKIIRKIRPKFSQGPDGIPPIAIIRMGVILSLIRSPGVLIIYGNLYSRSKMVAE